jgi:mRNA interferase MazF
MVKGSLVWVSLDPARGAEVPKTRPCIVVSRNEANDISSAVTVVPLSSVSGRAADRLVQPVLSAQDTLLPKDSRALCDQVRTIDKRRIRGTVGVLPAELLARVDRGLILHLGLCNDVRSGFADYRDADVSRRQAVRASEKACGFIKRVGATNHVHEHDSRPRQVFPLPFTPTLFDDDWNDWNRLNDRNEFATLNFNVEL